MREKNIFSCNYDIINYTSVMFVLKRIWIFLSSIYILHNGVYVMVPSTVAETTFL